MGHHIPVYPAKGYTLTATIKDPDRAPRIGGIACGPMTARSLLSRCSAAKSSI